MGSGSYAQEGLLSASVHLSLSHFTFITVFPPLSFSCCLSLLKTLVFSPSLFLLFSSWAPPPAEFKLSRVSPLTPLPSPCRSVLLLPLTAQVLENVVDSQSPTPRPHRLPAEVPTGLLDADPSAVCPWLPSPHPLPRLTSTRLPPSTPNPRLCYPFLLSLVVKYT